MGKTLYEKVYDSHVVFQQEGELPTLFIDRHLCHEVTSPQAFAGIEQAGRRLRHPELTLATMDHDISTREQSIEACSEMAQTQIRALMSNTKKFDVTLFGLGDPNQGIVHIVGPQVGFTLPGTTLVCGDSHTATHGAFGALAFGIGTSEVEHVMATQTLKQAKYKTMKIECTGLLQKGCSAKDLILAIIGKLTTAGGTGYAVEFAGEAVRALSMDGRMTLSNMAIEFGATVGMIAPDETTFEYIRGRLMAPKGADFDKAVEYWKTLKSDDDAHFDKVVTLDASRIEPQLTWGTNPGQECAITGTVPAPEDYDDPVVSKSCANALDYIALKPRQQIAGTPVDYVFIGSCTNGRIEDMRTAAEILKGRHVSPNVRTIVIPATQSVYLQCIEEGLAKIFIQAGAIVSTPTCGPCLGGHMGILAHGEKAVSTTNRNFVGRMGHITSEIYLASPAVAAASAVAGYICAPDELK